VDEARERFAVPEAPVPDLGEAYSAIYEKPRPIDENYEDLEVGAAPKDSETRGTTDGAAIVVTDETAVSGTHSLKFVDVGPPTNAWEPEMWYTPNFSAGVAVCRFDLRLEEGAVFWHIWRAPGAEGPHVIFNDADEVVVDNAPIARVPRGQWFNVEVECPLGDDADGTFTLEIGVPGKERQRFERLPCKTSTFRAVESCYFLSFAERETVFYLDNVRIALK